MVRFFTFTTFWIITLNFLLSSKVTALTLGKQSSRVVSSNPDEVTQVSADSRDSAYFKITCSLEDFANQLRKHLDHIGRLKVAGHHLNSDQLFGIRFEKVDITSSDVGIFFAQTTLKSRHWASFPNDMINWQDIDIYNTHLFKESDSFLYVSFDTHLPLSIADSTDYLLSETWLEEKLISSGIIQFDGQTIGLEFNSNLILTSTQTVCVYLGPDCNNDIGRDGFAVDFFTIGVTTKNVPTPSIVLPLLSILSLFTSRKIASKQLNK